MITARDNIAEQVGKFATQYNDDAYTEETITYLTKRFISNLVCLSLLFAASSFQGLTKETMTFLLAFLPLRRCFGGYHAKNEGVCLIISIIPPLLIAKMSIIMNISNIHKTVVYLFAYATVFIKGVVDNPVKRLTMKQKRKFKKQGIVTLILITVMHFYFVKHNNISNVITLAVFLSFSNLYIKNK